MAGRARKSKSPGDLGPVLSRAVARHPVWTHAEEAEAGRRLVAARRSGSAARLRAIEGEFVARNILLAVTVVQRHLGRGLDADDLMQESLAALQHATRKFDPAKGFRFSTYASWWLRQACGRSVAEDGALIHIPLHVTECRRVLLRRRDEFERDRGRAPTDAELARFAKMPVHKVTRALHSPGVTASIDVPFGDSGAVTIADLTASDAPSPLDATLSQERVRHAREALSRLPERTRLVVEQRFGPREQTLDEIAPQLSVTRERIRQIEGIALAALRGDATLRRLEGREDA